MILLFDNILFAYPSLLKSFFRFFRVLILANSLIIVSSVFFPAFKEFILSLTLQPDELFRFSGILGSFQIHSFLVLLYFIFAPRPNLLISTLLCSSCLFTSRSILPLVILIYIFHNVSNIDLRFIKSFKLQLNFIFYFSCLLLAFLVFYLFTSTDFYSVLNLYFNERLLTILQLDDYGIQGSINDNSRLLDLSFDFNSLFGFGNYRFSSPLSGGDSFYTRWIYGVGFFVLIPLELLKIVLSFRVSTKIYLCLIFYLLSIYLELKGDIVTTTLSLLFLLMYATPSRRRFLSSPIS